jgi:hypothetical protein
VLRSDRREGISAAEPPLLVQRDGPGRATGVTLDIDGTDAGA